MTKLLNCHLEVVNRVFRHTLLRLEVVNRVFWHMLLPFTFYLSIHSYMKISHVNRTYFAQQIVRCNDQQRLVKESYRLQNIKYVDINFHR